MKINTSTGLKNRYDAYSKGRQWGWLSAKPKTTMKINTSTWYHMARNAAAPSTADVYVYDEIGIWGITAKDFAMELNALDVSTIHLRVNSPGGSVVDTLAMMQALRNHPAKVVAHVDGLAASSASRLIMAADEIEMAENAFVMIHNVWSVAIGNAAEMRKEADVLDKFDLGLANDYAKRTGKEQQEILDLMAADTWMDAEDALELGFVDRIAEEQKAAACVSENFRACLNRFAAQLPKDYARKLVVNDGYKQSVTAPPPAPEEPEEPEEPAAPEDLTDYFEIKLRDLQFREKEAAV